MVSLIVVSYRRVSFLIKDVPLIPALIKGRILFEGYAYFNNRGIFKEVKLATKSMSLLSANLLYQ